jgi:hypothetical protein
MSLNEVIFMPRLNNRMLVDKSRDELRILIEKLLLHVAEVGGLSKVDKMNKMLLENVFSFYKRMNDINQEEVNVIWESASELVQNLLKKKAADIVDKSKSDDKVDKDRLLYGKYWIFPGKTPKYIKCENHVEYARQNGRDFIDGLGVDAYDYLHAINSGEKNIMPLILSAGGILAEFVMEGRLKVGRFQLTQVSLPWLKQTLNKMPIFRSHVRIVDPTEKYTGPQMGIYFSFRRTIKE